MELSHLFVFDEFLFDFEDFFFEVPFHPFGIGFSDTSGRSPTTS